MERMGGKRGRVWGREFELHHLMNPTSTTAGDVKQVADKTMS